MWQRWHDLGLVVLFVVGLAMLYLFYLIGIPFAYLANPVNGVRIWKEQFHAD